VSRRRVLVAGAAGRMGERLCALLAEHPEFELGAALERPGHAALGRELAPGVRLTESAVDAMASVAVAIVFANPAGSLELARLAAKQGVPCVIGTTGFRPDEKKEIDSLASHIPIVLAANFSVAVNVFFHLAREAGRLLGDGFDAEIVELHHAAKIDAPSGTALRIAEAIAEGRGTGRDRSFVLAREGETGARPAGSIGVLALRGGDNPGEHTALFLGQGERLELTHRSATRDHFARGALRAAAWVLRHPPGLYDMEHVIGLRPA
jgi:4-hydroxy-tetrahydrodipicolinate reductase